MVEPLPLAMRCLRLGFKILGLRRSSMVMELIMASILPNSLSAPLSSPSCLDIWPMPGMSLSRPSTEPSFFIRRIWVRKSSRSNLALAIFSPRALASSSPMVVWAFSMRVSTSPMPRMREAIRSGWKTSISFSFSPMPTNLMDFPVTSLMDKAAPPRASPSILVRTTPVKSRRSLKLSATVTASCPVMASATNRISWGWLAALMEASSPISFSSTCSRPAVSKSRTSQFCSAALASASRQMSTGSISVVEG